MIEEQIRDIIGLENTYIGEAPIDVDNCQWIEASSGSSKMHFGKSSYDYLEFPIFFRGTNQQETKQRVDTAYRNLRAYTGGNFVILPTGLPDFLGRDDKYRVVFHIVVEYQTGGF